MPSSKGMGCWQLMVTVSVALLTFVIGYTSAPLFTSKLWALTNGSHEVARPTPILLKKTAYPLHGRTPYTAPKVHTIMKPIPSFWAFHHPHLPTAMKSPVQHSRLDGPQGRLALLLALAASVALWAFWPHRSTNLQGRGCVMPLTDMSWAMAGLHAIDAGPTSSKPNTGIPLNAEPGWRCALTTLPSTRPTLGVSRWPDFDYNATGATTLGFLGAARDDGRLAIELDMTTFQGPSVCGATTKVFGVPLPPGINIDICPVSLKGSVDPCSGECELDFDAIFQGSIFGEGFIKLPPMEIVSPLTTGHSSGDFRKADGTPFGANGRPGEAELVGVARVPRVTGPWDWLMNTLLMMPTDALAVLPCRLQIWDPKTNPNPLDSRFEAELPGR
mmetsp:Transcript_122478/g.212345  ORF Transcript_122478/g.212345 Transcript_122478/m.212345 type:complete len:387 (-) Transcript_122478:1113-2273(-)